MQAKAHKNAEQETELIEYQEAELIFRARNSLLAFTLYTKPDYEVNWHHKVTCEYLEKFAREEIKRLLISQPPRHGKSELVSRRLPAYILGRDPDASIIACSYSDSLASRMNRDVQRIIDLPEYRKVFPKTRLFETNIRTLAKGTWLRNNEIFEIVGRRGIYRSAGIGSGITGLGANFAIIDDPIKNQEEADSKTYRAKIWEWYTSTLYPRLEKQGSVLLNTTRWNEDDVAGRLIKLMREDSNADQWVVLTFPAIKESEDSKYDIRKISQPLWPNKYSLQRLNSIKASVGTRVWNALYQQRPSALEGGIFKRKWFNNFYKIRPEKFDIQIQSWDMTFKDSKGSDYVVGQVWGRTGANYYLLDQIRDKIDFPTTINTLRLMSNKWPKARAKLIEDKANGPAVISTLKNEIVGLIPITPRESKQSRANAITPIWEAGNVYLPEPSIAPWIYDFIEECVNFPNATFDDVVDAMSQALNYMDDNTNKRLEKLLKF